MGIQNEDVKLQGTKFLPTGIKDQLLKLSKVKDALAFLGRNLFSWGFSNQEPA